MDSDNKSPLTPPLAVRLSEISARVAPPAHDHESEAFGYRLLVKGGVFDPALGRSVRRMADAMTLIPPQNGDRTLDIGAGTGILTLLMNQLAKPSLCVATDIMPAATHSIQENARRAGLRHVHPVQADLTQGIAGTFDYIVFNAPSYHPSLPPDMPGQGTLWDPTGTLKSRFVSAARSLLSRTNPRAAILMMYAEYRDYTPLDALPVDGFRVSRLLIERDIWSETGVLVLTNPAP